jgi:hypothetical protein
LGNDPQRRSYAGWKRADRPVKAEHAELRFGGRRVAGIEAGRHPAVVLLGATADTACPGRLDQARFRQDSQVMGDIALIAVQCRGELADGRLALAERGQQRPQVLCGSPGART